MPNTAKNVMKDVCKLSLQAELQKLAELDFSKIVYQTLSVEQIKQLAQKIGLLPFEYCDILFLRYCFSHTPAEIDRILVTENTVSKLRYLQRMLSSLMCLDNTWINDKSMEEACQIALVKYRKDYNSIKVLNKPNYSNAFRRKLKGIKIAKSPTRVLMSIAKRVAIFILVCIIGFSAVLAFNAEAREKCFDWIIEVFQKFSVFVPQNKNDENDAAKLTSLEIKYVPIEFELTDTRKGQKILVYNYSSKDNQKLTIKLFSSEVGSKSYYDTENAEIKEIIFKESQAYTWQTDEMTYLIWYQDGIECHIAGNLSIDEVFKVAENISKLY